MTDGEETKKRQGGAAVAMGLVQLGEENGWKRTCGGWPWLEWWLSKGREGEIVGGGLLV